MISVGAVLDDFKMVDVVLIHGMCTHDGTWAVDTNNKLIENLGFKKMLTNDVLPSVTKGIFNQTVVYKFINSEVDRTLRIYAILWSPETVGLKNTLFYDSCKNTNNCSAETKHCCRGLANSAIKRTLLDDCLADAIIYGGVSGKHINKQVIKAVKLILNDRVTDISEHSSPPLFFLSESLGSKVLFNALAVLIDDKDIHVSDAIGSTMQVFMTANQIPLLSLGDWNLSNPSESKNDSFSTFAKERNRLMGKGEVKQFGKMKIPPKLSLVAITDPNDLLSYTLQPSIVGHNKDYEVLDVLISNAMTWLWLLENPYSAHTGYLANPQVLRLIACGYKDSWKNCPQASQ